MALVLALGEEAAPAIADLVRDCLSHHAAPASSAADWERSKAATLVVVVECDGDGEACEAARKWMKTLRRSECYANFSTSIHRRVAVLALARSVCANSAAMLGSSEKYAGGGKVLQTLISNGCTRLVPLGKTEVELEPVETYVDSWVQTIIAALDAGDMEVSRGGVCFTRVGFVSAEVG